MHSHLRVLFFHPGIFGYVHFCLTLFLWLYQSISLYSYCCNNYFDISFKFLTHCSRLYASKWAGNYWFAVYTVQQVLHTIRMGCNSSWKSQERGKNQQWLCLSGSARCKLQTLCVISHFYITVFPVFGAYTAALMRYVRSTDCCRFRHLSTFSGWILRQLRDSSVFQRVSC